MKKINHSQMICIQTLLSKLNLKANSKVMVSGFTGGRSESTKDLYNNEANEMIKHLKELDPEEKESEKMRKKIISMAHEMGWHIEGSHQINMKQVDGWCCKFGLFKKKLNQHLREELVQLVTQFKNVHASFMEAV